MSLDQLRHGQKFEILSQLNPNHHFVVVVLVEKVVVVEVVVVQVVAVEVVAVEVVVQHKVAVADVVRHDVTVVDPRHLKCLGV